MLGFILLNYICIPTNVTAGAFPCRQDLRRLLGFLWLTANDSGSSGGWCLAGITATTATLWCLPHSSARWICLWHQKCREMACLVFSPCSWQPKMLAEAAGEGGFGLLLCMAAAKVQASSAAGSGGGQRTDLGAGSWEEVKSETTTAVCLCAPQSDFHSTFYCQLTGILAVFSPGKEGQQLT